MKDTGKNKIVTVIIVAATILLAGVAVFTAVRLYQLRGEVVSPESPDSKPAAAITDTVLLLEATTDGTNLSITYDKNFDTCAHLFITGVTDAIHTQNHYCDSGQTTKLVPLSEFNVDVKVGDTLKLCHGNDTNVCSATVAVTTGSATGGNSCPILTFTLTGGATNTPTPTTTLGATNTPTTSTPRPTNSPTPTDRPLGGSSPTPTSTVQPTNTVTATPTAAANITTAADGGDTLPDAGVPLPTIIGFASGILLVLFALALAL